MINSGGMEDAMVTSNDGIITDNPYCVRESPSCFFTKNNLENCAVMASMIAK